MRSTAAIKEMQRIEARHRSGDDRNIHNFTLLKMLEQNRESMEGKLNHYRRKFSMSINRESRKVYNIPWIITYPEGQEI